MVYVECFVDHQELLFFIFLQVKKGLWYKRDTSKYLRVTDPTSAIISCNFFGYFFDSISIFLTLTLNGINRQKLLETLRLWCSYLYKVLQKSSSRIPRRKLSKTFCSSQSKLLSAYRPPLIIDPILWLLMPYSEQSQVIRWHLSWLQHEVM
jgi:hypothetical protein